VTCGYTGQTAMADTQGGGCTRRWLLIRRPCRTPRHPRLLPHRRHSGSAVSHPQSAPKIIHSLDSGTSLGSHHATPVNLRPMNLIPRPCQAQSSKPMKGMTVQPRAQTSGQAKPSGPPECSYETAPRATVSASGAMPDRPETKTAAA
jgi:hypothetical protein